MKDESQISSKLLQSIDFCYTESQRANLVEACLSDLTKLYIHCFKEIGYSKHEIKNNLKTLINLAQEANK